MIDNPIWSIERALKHGYVMEPHVASGNFSGPLRMSRPGHECALVSAHIRRCASNPALKDENWSREPCANQCDECASICHMNDYTRAKSHCPPNYPMPATMDDTDVALCYLLLDSCPHENGPCVICIEKYIDVMECVCVLSQ